MVAVMVDNAGFLAPADFANPKSISFAPVVTYVRKSSTAVSGAATSAGAFYTPNGTTVTNDVFCILGYVEYGAGLTTVGTYNSNPTQVQLFGPGVFLPGQTVQKAVASTSNPANNASSVTLVDTGLSVAITPTSTCNMVLVRCSHQEAYNGAAVNPGYLVLALLRGASQIAGCLCAYASSSSGAVIGTLSSATIEILDAPASTLALTYKTQFRAGVTGMTASIENNGGTATAVVEEIAA
jgi:hypothetical protein